MRFIVQRHDTIDSTNSEAARQIARGAAAEGLCVVARAQTSGRGRHGRVWSSPPGAGLYASLVLRPQFEMSAWPLITLAAAVAVAETIGDTCGLTADIKWPNDVMIGERKVCGILAETVDAPPESTGDRRGVKFVVLGIGINVRRGAYPPELGETATSLEEAAAGALALRPPPRRHADDKALLGALLGCFAERYAGLETPDGRRAILEEWSARSSYAENCRVRIECGEGEGAAEGVTRGLDPAGGALRVETDDGRVRSVHAGDVRKVRARPGGR